VDRGIPPEAGKCLALVAELIGRIGEERVATWPELLFALLIDGPIGNPAVRAVVCAVLKALSGSAVLAMFAGFADVSDKQAEERVRVFFEARADIRHDLAMMVPREVGGEPEWLTVAREV
jgi:hypothetical protein